ncbi:MAG: peptidoglycan-binding protein [Myxococcales bacterium]|nr:peptidoglycan-binding protein [Myxococcales bacterium]
MLDEELVLAGELLSLDDDYELDRFLGGLIRGASRAAGRALPPEQGRVLGGILKAIARQELPALGHPESSEVEDELKRARRFLRRASSAARRAAAIPRKVPPRTAARLAVVKAFRRRRRRRKRSPSRRRPVTAAPRSGARWPRQPATGSARIRWAQEALNRVLGLRLAVDGIVGPQTRSATRSFQARVGLVVDGILGHRTLAALRKAVHSARPRPRPTPPPAAPPQGEPAPPAEPAAPAAPGEPTVHLNEGVVISPNAVNTLKEVLRSARLGSATITSGRRTSQEQARVMYNLIQQKGVQYAKDLYGSNGDQVIDVYAAGKGAGQSPDAIRQAMQSRILQLGPANVSKHASDDHDVFDVAPSSIADKSAFEHALEAARAAGQIDKVIMANGDPAYHVEIKLNPSEEELMLRALRAHPLARAAYPAAGARSLQFEMD